MEHYIVAAGLKVKYAQIIEGLQMGFKIDFPSIVVTQTLPDWPSTVEYSAPFLTIIHNEFEKGRYIGLFTQTEL